MAKMYNEFRIRRSGIQSRQPVTCDAAPFACDESGFIVRVAFRKASKPTKWLDVHLSPDEALVLAGSIRKAAEAARVANAGG
jgi:hypothetical protein